MRMELPRGYYDGGYYRVGGYYKGGGYYDGGYYGAVITALL